MGLSWPALEAWAHDETLLVPMGLHRGFVCVQPSQWDGTLITMDQLTNTSLGAGTTISIPHASKHPDGEVCVQHTWCKCVCMQCQEWISGCKGLQRLATFNHLLRKPVTHPPQQSASLDP